MTDMTGRGPALSAGLCMLLHLAVLCFRCLLCDELVLPLLTAATLNAALLPKPLAILGHRAHMGKSHRWGAVLCRRLERHPSRFTTM